MRGAAAITRWIEEIDAQMVEVSKTRLRAICGEAFTDPRLELVIADGVDFLAKSHWPS